MVLQDRDNGEVPWTDEELGAKIGQLFIVGFHGHVPSEDIKTLITKHMVGAIILFQRNVENASQLPELTDSLQEIARSSGHKQSLFISIDQENGLVTRIKPPISTQLPGAMALGATGDASNAFKVALATGEVLKSFGINMNYAPIADVNSEPNNPVIGVRSPSDNPETVGRFVSAQVKGLRQGGVIPCVKHFPGHGDTAVDSHYGLPVISKRKSLLDACELVPFRRAVVEGVEAVMTAHIAMPGIGDPRTGDDNPSNSLPASLNPEAINILRGEMRYKGLIISDCLEMDGVRATYGTEKSAVMALKAGTDCVMICHTMSAQVGAIELVVQAVKSGEIFQASIEASLDRIRELKQNFSSASAHPVRTSTLAEIEANNARHSLLSADLYAKSTTVVRSVPGFIPFSRYSETKIFYLLPGKSPSAGGAVESGEEKTREPYLGNKFMQALKSSIPGPLSAKQYFELQPFSQETEDLITEADVVVFCSRNAHLSQYQKNLGLALGKRLGNKLIIIATCDPYDFLEDTEIIKNYITMYEPTVEAFVSALKILQREISPVGVLPIGSKHPILGIRALDSSSKDDISLILKQWQEIFPTWPMERERLAWILTQGDSSHFIHQSGFCLAYSTQDKDGLHGMISVIGVLEGSRGRGVGTHLLKSAKRELEIRSQNGNAITIGISSSFPRFWPGVSLSLPQDTKDWFSHRGFNLSREPTARDLFKSITTEIAPPNILEKVKHLPLTFSPWSPELYEECMVKQRANFGKNAAWVQAYERLAAANQHHEALVAFNETGVQVGWTLMCHPDSVIGRDFAFLPLLPSKKKTGLIACVGVDESARKKGIGLALLVKAMEDMRARGLEGVLIDWVVIRGFYETLGFDVVWEYAKYDW